MARPQKTNADYFPHLNNLRNDRRCKALRSKFRLEGYAVFVMLLEALTQADHFCIAHNSLEIELLAGDFDIDSNLLKEILEYSIKLGLICETNDNISSPLLGELKTMLEEHRARERERKNSAKRKVFPPESTQAGEVFPSENEQSKAKETEEKNSKTKDSKGNMEFTPKTNLKEENGLAGKQEKEKGSAEKEKDILSLCKTLFLNDVPMYIWENKDEINLQALIGKIRITLGDEVTPDKIMQSFQWLILNLPAYWRSKKFTLANINQNFNEILNEIRSNAAKPNSIDNSNSGKFGRHDTIELANRAKTFGRKGFGN